VVYSGPNGCRYYVLAPLDVSPGKSEETKDNKYLWAYSEKNQTVISMRMDKVAWSKPNNEPFDSAEILAAVLKGKEHTWTLPREW
jgi:hypothetical protein